MAVGSVGGVLSAASSFLGFAALRASMPEGRVRPVEPAADGTAFDPHDTLAPGGTGYEAVAEALDQAGYLDA